MKNQFVYNAAGDNDTIRIEQVCAEKPGGAMIVDPGYDAKASTPVGRYKDNGNLRYGIVKQFKVIYIYSSTDTTLRIYGGSGIKAGDFIGYGKNCVTVSKVEYGTELQHDGGPEHYVDTLTLSAALGVSLTPGDILYQAAAAGTDKVNPIYTPEFILGNDIEGGNGDQPARIVLIGTVRRETACIGADMLSLLPTIKLV